MKKPFLTILLGVFLVTSLTTGCKKDENAPQIPTDGLVAYYPFNGNANDESGNGNNGTVNGATLTTDRHGNPNSSYNFRGFNYGDKITIPNNSSLSFSNEISISLWTKQASQSGMDEYGNSTPNGNMTFISKDIDRGGFYWSTGNDASTGTSNMTFAINNKTNESGVQDYSNSLINNVSFNNEVV